MPGDVASDSTVPVIPEDELTKSGDETEFGKSRVCDLYTGPLDTHSCPCITHQLAIEVTELLRSRFTPMIFARGPPTA